MLNNMLWPLIGPVPAQLYLVHSGGTSLSAMLVCSMGTKIGSLDASLTVNSHQTATPWVMGCVEVSMKTGSATGKAAPMWHCLTAGTLDKTPKG